MNKNRGQAGTQSTEEMSSDTRKGKPRKNSQGQEMQGNYIYI